MDLNFAPVWRGEVPWVYLSHKSGVTHQLLDNIRSGRVFGTALSASATHRNEAVAKR